jgi:DNA-binding response OmpR family regulator
MAHILLVEDTSELRVLLRFVLERMGHKVIEAGDARRAAELLGQQAFDLLITDIVLPEDDGLTLVRAAKAQTPSPLVLAMSGVGAQFPAAITLKLSEALGADAILYKPFHNDEFVNKVTAVLAGEGHGQRKAAAAI